MQYTPLCPLDIPVAMVTRFTVTRSLVFVQDGEGAATVGKMLSAREPSAAMPDGGGGHGLQSPTHASLANHNSKPPAASASAGSGSGSGSGSSGANPHKYLLYKPSFAQLIAFLAAAFKELPANGVLLLYISAEGAVPPPLTGAAARAAKQQQLDDDPCIMLIHSHVRVSL